MKKALKIVGVLLVVGFTGGLVWYFQSLKIAGDAALKTCWAVDIIDDVTGEKVVGAEDLDFDYESETIFLSAYDRRAVDREIKQGNVTTQGGIYTLKVSDIHQTGVLPVHDITREYKQAGNEFRPHGIFFRWDYYPSVFAINRRYAYKDTELSLTPTFEDFEMVREKGDYNLAGGRWVHKETFIPEGVCDPYDAQTAYIIHFTLIIFTDVTGKCQPGSSSTEGIVRFYTGTESEVKIEGLSFPNGLALADSNIAVALTRENSILLLIPDEKKERGKIDLPIAPDNLTVDENENLYVAGFPNLLDHYFYMSELFGVEKSPSAAYRIAPETYEQTLLFKDDGTMISGATTALRAGDYLIMGSAWDDNIAICSGMDKIDG